MIYYLVKIAVTTALVVLVSEVSRRSTLIGGILASMPLISVLGIIWLYADTRDVTRVVDLSQSIFWLVIPSLALFVALPVLLHRGLGFPASLILAIGTTLICYYAVIAGLGWLGIRL